MTKAFRHLEGPVTAYLAPEGLEDVMLRDLRDVLHRAGRLVVAQGAPQFCPWAQNVWFEPRVLAIQSIGDAARQLKALQRNWWPYAHAWHRRTELIQAQLPHVSAKALTYPAAPKAGALGSWTLLDETTILCAPRCASVFPNGEPTFHEDHVNPPSRAYLKLWEAFTRLGVRPAPGERCLELGASPGGWTWVLRECGAHVTAVDRAPLADKLMTDPLVTFVKGDAFAVKPDAYAEPFDWLFSDIICYPEKLVSFVEAWRAAGKAKRFICTLKFQGEEHYGAIAEALKIPGSEVFHLAHNKHELTWFMLRS